MTPTRIAIIGMGGFAGSHHQGVRALEAEGVATLACTCDPFPDAFAAQQEQWAFAQRGVRVFTDYLEMLAACGEALDCVTIPTPIPLHAPMHRACVERGLPVYLEKPPTLDYRELAEMQVVDANATKATQVGFNYIIDAVRREVKRRLLAGEFGACRQVTVRCLWPRNAAYYQRAGWAGRLRVGDRLVLDSPMGNAMAHYVHNALFWAGVAELDAWAALVGVEAELYRANPIQGTDTVFVTAGTAAGPEVRIALSHACAGEHQTEERVVCDAATLHYTYIDHQRAQCRIAWRDGRAEVITGEARNFLVDNLRAYCGYLRGQADRPVTRLADSRPFVELNNLAYIAARAITPVGGEAAQVTGAWEDGTAFTAIRDLSQAFDTFITTGAFPSAQGLPWARATGHAATPAQLGELDDVVHRMVVEE